MGVTAEVLHHMTDLAEGLFDVDDPVGGREPTQELLKAFGIGKLVKALEGAAPEPPLAPRPPDVMDLQEVAAASGRDGAPMLLT